MSGITINISAENRLLGIIDVNQILIEIDGDELEYDHTRMNRRTKVLWKESLKSMIEFEQRDRCRKAWS